MLTANQHKALGFIRRWFLQRGHAPSLAEIAAGIGIRSRGVAHRHVEALIRAGYLVRLPGRKRGLRPVEHPRPEGYMLPLLGRIAAGRPIEAIPGQETLDLAAFLLGPGRYALQVRGDSMIEAGILDGDTVIVQQTDTAHDHDIVVALIDGQDATLKRLGHRPDGSIALIAANPAMAPMIYSAERITIQGVVVGQMRSYR